MRPTITPVLLALACLSAAACSGTTPPDQRAEESREIAREEAGQITALIKHNYFHGRPKKFEDSTYSSDHTTRETINLYVSSPKHKSPAYANLPETPLFMSLYEDENKEDRTKYLDKDAQILIDVEGERIAYQLGDDPWQLVYLTPESLLHAPAGTLTSAPSDWSTVPTLLAHALPVWLAHDSYRGFYREGKRAYLLKHIEAHADDQTRCDILASLIDDLGGAQEQWVKTAKTLSPASQARLVAALEAKPDAWKAPKYVQRHITEWMAAVKAQDGH